MENNTVQQPTNEPTTVTQVVPSPIPQPAPAAPQMSEPITPLEIGSAFSLFSPSVAALKFNLKTYLSVYGAIILLVIVQVFISVILGTISRQSTTGTQTVSLLLLLIPVVAIIVLSLVLGPVIAYVQIQSARSKKVTVSESISTGSQFILRFIGLALVIGFLIAGGLMLFIIPGFIMIRRYFLSPYLLIDKNLGIFEAMSQSAAMTKSHSGKIWGIIGVNILLSMSSIVPIIGSVVSLVLGLLYGFAPAIRYVQLDNITARPTAIGEPIPPTPTPLSN